jgi:hypothetical protein
MAPITSTSRKRDRRKMMREAEVRRQQQNQQQQQPPIPNAHEVTSSCDIASVATTTSMTMTHDNASCIVGTGLSGTAFHTTSRKMVEKQQDHGLNQAHPPDCRCVLSKLVRDDLFLPFSIKNKGIDEADDKA